MIRRYNYTNRKNLKKGQFQITINENGSYKDFYAKINLDSLKLPGDASIYVEAYYKTDFIRFDFGTVSEPEIPSNTDITNLLGTDLILFRIKIVDENEKNGRLLASLSGIQPVNTSQEHINKVSILHVNYDAKLEQRLFRIEFEELEKFPILEINRKLENKSEIIKSEIFATTIYPSVIQEIATVIANDNIHYEIGEECWQGYWLKYFQSVLKVTTPMPTEKQDELVQSWIEEVVFTYCKQNRVSKRFSSLNPN